MKEELSAGKETNLNALMDKYFPKGVKKENVNFGKEIQSLFRELGGSIHEENEKSGKDEIWSRIRTLGNKDSDSYHHCGVCSRQSKEKKQETSKMRWSLCLQVSGHLC